MQILKAEFNWDAFFRALKEARARALLLDYDGTLAPFHASRDRALPYPGVPEVLNGILEAGHTRVIVVTGRHTADLVPLLNLQPRPEIWGTHGFERLKEDGSYEAAQLSRRAQELLCEAERWCEQSGLGAHCERKPGAVAVHWRGLPPEAAEQLRKRIVADWQTKAQSAGLSLQPFDGGIEFRPRGLGKGRAVSTVLAEMDPNTVAAYLGDDMTDEDAFTAVKPSGVAILVREALRPTRADLWLKPPHELLEFLNTWHLVSSSSR